jgi:hypothetical protein
VLAGITVENAHVSKTMKATFVTEFGKPLTMGELPAPQRKASSPQPGTEG